MPKELSEKDKEQVAKKLSELRQKELEVFTHYLHSPWKLFMVNFLAGTAKGLGFFVGAAIIIAILGYVLSQILADIPYLGDFFKNASEFLNATRPNNRLTP